MKKCTSCEIELPDTAFPFVPSKGKYLSKCRECKREYDRQYWNKTKNKRNSRKKFNASKIDKRNKQFVWDYLSKHPCPCGESDPRVLEFDHIRDKIQSISVLACSKVSLETLKCEIEKCQVLCANCHRRKTAEEFGWFTGV